MGRFAELIATSPTISEEPGVSRSEILRRTVLGDLQAVERLGRIVALQADRNPPRLGVAGGEFERREEMRAERLLGVLERDRRVEHAAEFLPHEEMAGGRLALAPNLIDLLGELVGKGAGLGQAIRLLERLDGDDRGPPERAVEFLRFEMAELRQDVLHADDAVGLGPARHEDAERGRGARLGGLDGRGLGAGAEGERGK